MQNNCGFPIEVVQGADFSWPIYWQDPDGNVINLSGYTAQMQIRNTVNSSGAPLVECTVAISASLGLIMITIPNATTAALPAPAKGVYDIFVTVGGVKTRILWGDVTISERVTK
jgi:hypothetical protein